MKILVLCDQGNNRSVTIAHQLKYWRHDILTAGLKANPQDTIRMLSLWADRIIYTHTDQVDLTFYEEYDPEIFAKLQLWDVGPDTFPRPFNKELLAKVKRLMAEHEAEYKPRWPDLPTPGGEDFTSIMENTSRYTDPHGPFN